MSKPILLCLVALLIAASLALFLPDSRPLTHATAVSEPVESARQTPAASETIPQAAGGMGNGFPQADDIFAAGPVTCDGCGETRQKVELRHAPDAPSKIALILESLRDQNGMSGCDPRVAQLVALGDGAVNDLLEAFDAVNAEGAENKGYRGGAARFALQWALEQLLKAKDKEIILTYFEQRAFFTDLVRKYRFPEAGEIALRRLQAPAMRVVSTNADGSTTYRSSFRSFADPAIAVALSPSNAIPWMLEEMQGTPLLTSLYLPALAEHAPQVDIRPQMAEVLASENSAHRYTATKLAPFALARGVAAALDATVRLLRDSELSHAHPELLTSVRQHMGFVGTADQAAQWIEQNRDRLVWNEEKKKFVVR